MVRAATHGKWQGGARRGSRHSKMQARSNGKSQGVARKGLRHGKVLGKEQVKAVLV